MVASSTEVTPKALRDWPLPSTASDKYARGQVLVVGGAVGTPGAALLAGLAALRVGAGHLTLAVADAVAVGLAVAVPEAGVTALPSTSGGAVRGDDVSAIADSLGSADVVLVGPGLDDLDQAAELVRQVVPRLGGATRLVLDAYALAPLPGLRTELAGLDGRLVLTPNKKEAQVLLEDDDVEIGADQVVEIARRYGAVVACQAMVANPAGDLWTIGAGQEGLATSGSGDVLSGSIAGVAAAGAELDQAVCWATYAHAAAGDRLAARVGRLGYLAREILDELPPVMVELNR